MFNQVQDGPFKSIESSDLEIKGSKGNNKGIRIGSQTFEPSKSVGPYNSQDGSVREQAANSVTSQITSIENLIMKANVYLEEYK